MKTILKKNWIVIAILFLSILLRFYSIGDFPTPLKWDEAAIGYNAYSILETGRDEYGNLFPIIFKSFGDYKPGLYIYTAVPLVALLGLTETAVRFPSAFFGVLSVLLVYLICKKLFDDKIALSSALILAISPWHLEFSRGAWEANLALFLLLCGFLFFLGIKKNRSFLFLSALFFGLTFWSYQGAKVSTALFLLGVLIFFSNSVKNFRKRQTIVALGIITIFILPTVIGITGRMGGRMRVTSLFSYTRKVTDVQNLALQDRLPIDSLNFQVFHSEELSFVRGIAERYFYHLSPRFLFFDGDWSNKRLGVPYGGVLYFIDIVFLLLGLKSIILDKRERFGQFVLFWLFVSPVPAAITRDAVSGVRALNMVIPLSIICGFGLVSLFSWIKVQKYYARFVLISLLVGLWGWNFLYFTDQYLVHAPKQFSSTDQYGYKEAVEYVKSINKNYETIYFTQRYGQPYIYWLFYNQYPPSKYQQQAYLTENQWGDVGIVERLDNVIFKNVYFPDERDCHNCLYIDNDLGVPDDDLNHTSYARVLKEIRFHDGKIGFRIVETN